MKQQFQAYANVLITLGISDAMCGAHTMGTSPCAICAAHARCRIARGGGRGPGRVGAYIYMDNYTDEENEVLTTKITVLMLTPCAFVRAYFLHTMLPN